MPKTFPKDYCVIFRFHVTGINEHESVFKNVYTVKYL